MAPPSDASTLPPPTPAEIELVWDAPPQCPAAQSIEQRYRDLLTGPPAGVGLMRVEARVRTTTAGYSLALTTEYLGRLERRVLDASECADLGEATAMVIAISMEPTVPLDSNVPMPSEPIPSEPPPSEPSEPPPSEPSVPNTREPALVLPPPSERPGAPRVRPHPMLRVAAGLERGALPAATALQELTVGLLWPRARLELTGRFLWPRRIHAPDGSDDASARVLLGAIGLHGCARPRMGRVEMPICAGVEGGVVRADSRGLEPAGHVLGPWMGPSASAGIAHRWSRVGVWASGMLVGRVWNTRTALGSAGAIEPEIASLRVVAGLETFFGLGQP